MRVGILTYGLDRPLSGVGRVALELGHALHDARSCEVVFLTPYRHGPFSDKRRYSSAFLPGCRLLPGLMLLGGAAVAAAARRHRLDLVHDPVGVSPFTLARWAGSFKRVLTIHDAIAFRYPEGYPWLNNLLHRRHVPATLPNVDAVIADSRHSREEVSQFLAVPANRMHVVRNGVSPRFRPVQHDQARSVAARHGLAGPFVLSVGAQQARKNLGRLLAAFAQLRATHPDYRLAIVGPTLWRHDGLHRQIAALGIQDAVSIIGYVPDEDLPALYSAASLFLFPSLYEGFGLPVLEAMACGTPVVCSNTTSLPEVAADAAVLVDPTDVEGMADAMSHALDNLALRSELRERGIRRAAELTWERAARETLTVYQAALGAHGR